MSEEPFNVYCDRIYNFFNKEDPWKEFNLIDITTDRDKFIKAIKHIIDTGRLPELEFNNDYTKIRKTSYSDLMRKPG